MKTAKLFLLLSLLGYSAIAQTYTLTEINSPNVRFCTINTFQVQIESSTNSTFDFKITLDNQSGKVYFDNNPNFNLICLGWQINSTSIFSDTAIVNITLQGSNPCILSYNVVPTPTASSAPLSLYNIYKVVSTSYSLQTSYYDVIFPESKVTCAYQVADTVTSIGQTFMREVTLFNSSTTDTMNKPMKFMDVRTGDTCVRIIEVGYKDNSSQYFTLLTSTNIIHGIGTDTFQLDTNQIATIAAAQGISGGKFCPTCYLKLQITYQVTCCFNADIYNTYNTSWACNINDPPIYQSAPVTNITAGVGCTPPPNSTLRIHPNFSKPHLNIITRRRDMNYCYGPNQVANDTLRIINHNNSVPTGIASNIILDLTQWIGYNFTDIIQTSFAVTINGVPGTASLIDSIGQYTACDGAHRFTGLKVSLPALNANDTAIVTWNSRTCPPGDSSCSISNAVKDSWKYKIYYDGQCNLDSSGDYTNFVSPTGMGKMITDYNGLYDIDDNVIDTALVDLSEVGVWPASNSVTFNRRVLVKIELGRDLQFVPSTGNIGNINIFLPTLPPGCQNLAPISDSLAPCDTISPNILYAEFNISDTSCFHDTLGLQNFHNAELFFIFKGSCQGPCTGSSAQPADVIKTNVYYIPDTICAQPCSLLVGCNETQVQLHCPGCIRKGLHSLSYNIHRATFGFEDCDNDNRWDPDALCQPQQITEAFALAHPEIKSRRAMVGDILKGTLNTLVVNNSSYGPTNSTLVFHYAYWKSQIAGGYGTTYYPNNNPAAIENRLEPIDITIVFSPTSPTDSILTSGPVRIVIPGTSLVVAHIGTTAYYNLDFSIDTCIAYFSTILNPYYSSFPLADFYDGLSISLTHRFRVRGNIGSNVSDCFVGNTAYLGVIADNNFNTLVDPDNIVFYTPPSPTNYDNYCSCCITPDTCCHADTLLSSHPPCSQFQWYCSHNGGKFQLVGYYFHVWGNVSNLLVNEACGGVLQGKILSFGLGHGNGQQGINIFRYEYRNWINMHQLRWDIPAGYIPSGFGGTIWYNQFFNENGYGNAPIYNIPQSRYLITPSAVILNYSYVDSVFQNGVDPNSSQCGIGTCSNTNFGIIRKPDDDFFDYEKYAFAPGCNVPGTARADFYEEMDFIPTGGSSIFTADEPWGMYADARLSASSITIDTANNFTAFRHDTIAYTYGSSSRPLLSINAQPTWNGYHSPECMTFSVLNTQSSPNGNASHAWVSFVTSPCVSITSITVDNITHNNPTADSLYYFTGTFYHDSTKYVTICFNYNCSTVCNANRFIYLMAGWDCNRTSTTVATMQQYNDSLGCILARDTTEIIPYPAQFNATLTRVTANPTVCDTILYDLTVNSTAGGSLYSITISDTLPCSNMTYSPNSSQFTFAGNTVSAEPDTSHTFTGAQVLVWHIDSISSYIFVNGLAGSLLDSLHSHFTLRYGIHTGCGVCYHQRGIVHIDYVTNCGVTGSWSRNFAPLLDSTNAPFNDLSDSLSAIPIATCDSGSHVTVTLINNNPNTNLLSNNQLEVTLPTGFSADSFNIAPTTIIGQVLNWHLTSLTPITFYAHSTLASCGTHTIIASIYARDTLPCGGGGITTCFINELEYSDTAVLIINPPDSSFICPTSNILCREPYHFIPTNSCGYFVWDFGDGDSSNVISPSHIYADAGTYTVTLVVYSNPLSPTGCSSMSTCQVTVDCPPYDCGGFCTYNMQGWGSPSPTTEPQPILDSDFYSVFPTLNNNLIFGCPATNWIQLTSPSAVRCFLPFGGSANTSLPLTTTFTDPYCGPPNNGCSTGTNIRNQLIAEIAALNLNVYFDLLDTNFSPNSVYHLAYLTIVGNPVIQPIYYGMKVIDVLDTANHYLGGCSSLPAGMNDANLQATIHQINVSFEHCHHTQHGQMYDCDSHSQHARMLTKEGLQAHAEPENGSCMNSSSAKAYGSALGGTPPYAYLWSTGDTTNVIEGLTDGTYTLTVTDVDGETSTTETIVRTSSAICCGSGTATLPQFPVSTTVSSFTSYNVNYLPSNEVGFYENLKMSGNTFYIAEGVPFIVHDGTTLSLNQCILKACGKMWKGIIVEPGGTLVLSGSTISDAEYGIYAMEGSKFYVYNSNFKDNVVGIESAPNPLDNYNDIDFTVAGTTFDFSGTLKDAYPEQPEFGTKPKAGIEFRNMFGTIGDNNYNENIFKNLNCGIISYESALQILNSRFLNISNDLYYTEPFMGSGVASPGGPGALITVLPYKNQTAASPTFHNCKFGIYGMNLVLDVSDCVMDSMKTGIYATKCALKNSVEATGNMIVALNGGIIFDNNEGADALYAASNTIITTNPNGVCIGAYEAGEGENNLDLEDNDLYCTGSITGIDIAGCSGSLVFHNQITEVSPGLFGFTGINVNGCEKPLISCNTVTGQDTSANHKSFGIRLNVTENGTLHCNTVNQTTRGLGFFGLCSSKDGIDDNEMNEHFEGMFLNSNAIIGTQTHTGNRWLGSFTSGDGANNLNSTAAGLSASQFTVHTIPSTIYYPNIPTYDSSWFVSDTTGTPYSCADLSECPDGSMEYSASQRADSLDYYIAKNYNLSDDFVSETKSIARQYLYQKLTAYPALMSGSSALQSFYNTYSSASVGQLQGVKDSIKALDYYSNYFSGSIHIMDSLLKDLSDSLTYLDSLTNNDKLNAETYIAQKKPLRLQAASLQSSIAVLKSQLESIKTGNAVVIADANQNISTSQVPEDNDKVINGIYLQTIGSGIYSLDEYQTGIVASVARQCPYAGGKSVYRARTLYRLVNANAEYTDDSICLVVGIYRSEKQHQHNNTYEKVTVVPNPANNIVTVYYASSELNCTLYLTDLSGKIVKTVALPSDKVKYEFSVSDIVAGLYMVNVNNDKTTIGRTKLAIAR